MGSPEVHRLFYSLLAVSVILLSTFSVESEAEAGLVSLEEYLKTLERREQNGSTLYCEDISPAGRDKYNSCSSFTSLRKRGCYGYTSYEISREISYAGLCEKLSVVRQAKPSTDSFIDTESKSWWEKLPAEIIPMSGGVYSNESWEIAQDDRKELVSDKLVGQLSFDSVTANMNKVEIVIDAWKEDCGEVQDYFEFSPILLADFDGDGIAELLIGGSRFNRSETCHLGTGNRFGAGFSVLVKMTGESASPSVSHL